MKQVIAAIMADFKILTLWLIKEDEYEVAKRNHKKAFIEKWGNK